MSRRTDVELVDALLHASRALVGVAARSLAGSGDVTLPQWRALVLVSSRGRTTVSDLASALGIHPTSASRLCDRLVRKRLIRRTEATGDRRQTDLHLAAAGRRLVERVTQSRRRDLESAVARMQVADAEALVRALHAFAEASELAAVDDPFGWDLAT